VDFEFIGIFVVVVVVVVVNEEVVVMNGDELDLELAINPATSSQHIKKDTARRSMM
jgi:hypothetical protein